MQWLARNETQKSFHVEIGFGADRNHANNVVRRNFSLAGWTYPTGPAADSFNVSNTVSESTETITFTTELTNPAPGWSVALTPPSVALAPGATATIQVTLTPPLPWPSGTSQTVHITPWISTQKLGGVSIQAIVP